MATGPEGSTPVVYRLDLRDAKSYFLAQRFPIEDKDIIYVANADLNELQKFFTLLNTLTGPGDHRDRREERGAIVRLNRHAIGRTTLERRPCTAAGWCAAEPCSRMIALDLSRLLSRAGRGTPTGIDRVELAYAEHLIAGGHRGLLYRRHAGRQAGAAAAPDRPRRFVARSGRLGAAALDPAQQDRQVRRIARQARLALLAGRERALVGLVARQPTAARSICWCRTIISKSADCSRA